MNTPKWLMPPRRGAVVGGVEVILSCFPASNGVGGGLYRRPGAGDCTSGYASCILMNLLRQ